MKDVKVTIPRPEVGQAAADLGLAGALCTGRPQLFDASEDETVEDRQYRSEVAARLCAVCPVRRRCEVVADLVPAQHRRGMVWAGRTR